MSFSKKKNLVGVLYVGKNVSFLVFDLKKTVKVTSHQVPINTVSSHPGWVEQNPDDWLKNLDTCVEQCSKEIGKLSSLIICNTHTTIVVWDKTTGKPFCNSIGPQDSRINEIEYYVDKLYYENEKDIGKNGYTCSSYCSIGEFLWFRENVPEVQQAIKEDRFMFGTIDTWLLWNITGGINGGMHKTDLTNASHTMLMNIETLDWNDNLLDTIKLPRKMLPTIHSNIDNFGIVKNWSMLNGIAIVGLIEDRQAILMAQGCITPGCALNTYGTNCKLTFNIGPGLIEAPKGMRTTVAYKLGENEPISYAIEGDLQGCYDALLWVYHMHFLDAKSNNPKDLTDAVVDLGPLAEHGGVYFVPAFKGLCAPHWRKDARGIFCGLTQFATRDHLSRAALSSICFYTCEIFDLIRRKGILPLHEVYVDGEIAENSHFLSLLSDILGFKLKRITTENVASLGATILAGHAADKNYNPETIGKTLSTDIFHPTASTRERIANYGKWQMAVRRSFGWATPSSKPTLPPHKPSTPMKSLAIQFGPRQMNSDLDTTQEVEIKFEPRQAMESELELTPALKSTLKPTQALESKLEPHQAMESKLEPHQAMESKLEPHQAMESKLEPKQALESKFEPHQAMESKLEPHQAMESKLDPTHAMTSKSEAPQIESPILVQKTDEGCAARRVRNPDKKACSAKVQYNCPDKN